MQDISAFEVFNLVFVSKEDHTLEYKTSMYKNIRQVFLTRLLKPRSPSLDGEQICCFQSQTRLLKFRNREAYER